MAQSGAFWEGGGTWGLTKQEPRLSDIDMMTASCPSCGEKRGRFCQQGNALP